MRKEIIISKDIFHERYFHLIQQILQNKKCNFIGMGMFDSFGIMDLVRRDNKFTYYPRDEKKFLIKRFPICIAYNINYENFETILDLYWSDNIMENRIIAFYEKEIAYSEKDINEQREIDFVYENKEFIFAIENCPENENDEYLLVFAKNIESLKIEDIINNGGRVVLLS